LLTIEFIFFDQVSPRFLTTLLPGLVLIDFLA